MEDKWTWPHPYRNIAQSSERKQSAGAGWHLEHGEHVASLTVHVSLYECHTAEANEF